MQTIWKEPISCLLSIWQCRLINASRTGSKQKQSSIKSLAARILAHLSFSRWNPGGKGTLEQVCKALFFFGNRTPYSENSIFFHLRTFLCYFLYAFPRFKNLVIKCRCKQKYMVSASRLPFWTFWYTASSWRKICSQGTILMFSACDYGLLRSHILAPRKTLLGRGDAWAGVIVLSTHEIQ